MDKETKIKLKVYSDAYKRLKEEKEINENIFDDARKVRLYLARSQDDYLLAQAVKKVIETQDLRNNLNLPKEYPNIYHWLIIISYYSMYHSATAAIAKKNIKCESHEATITSLARHYGTAEEIEFSFIKTLHVTYIDYIASGREKRRGAQYNVDEEYAISDALEVFDNAGKFIKRIQQLLEE